MTSTLHISKKNFSPDLIVLVLKILLLRLKIDENNGFCLAQVIELRLLNDAKILFC